MSLVLSGNSGSMTIDSTSGVTFPDSSVIISHAVPQVTVYTTSSGTYTVPTNAKYLQIKMVGGGGGAGGAATIFPGSGGGSGAFIEAYIVSPSSSYSYSVGAGGTASTAGTSGFAGGAGGSGVIYITAFF